MKESKSFQTLKPIRNFADFNDSTALTKEPNFNISANYAVQNNPIVQLKKDKIQAQKLSSQKKENSNRTILPENIQLKMETAFNADFSNLSIHKNSIQAKSFGAQAFTSGNEVHFAPGYFNPHSNSGQELIGHELAHVVQQKEGRVSSTNEIEGQKFNTANSLENEADHLGKKAASGKQINKSVKPVGQSRLGNQVVQGFGLGDITDWTKKKASGIGGGISDWASEKAMGIKGAVSGGVNFVKNKASSLVGKGSGMISNVGKLFGKGGRMISNVGKTISGTVGQTASQMLKFVSGITRFTKNAAKAIETIISNPTGFLKNILKAVKNGFGKFFGNISEFVLKGLIEWLSQRFADLGLEIPESFDLKSILGLVLQIIQKVWDSIRKKLGDKLVDYYDMVGPYGIKILKKVIESGPSAIFEVVKNLLTSTSKMAIDKVKSKLPSSF